MHLFCHFDEGEFYFNLDSSLRCFVQNDKQCVKLEERHYPTEPSKKFQVISVLQ
jgi:hypothetical protein